MSNTEFVRNHDYYDMDSAYLRSLYDDISCQEIRCKEDSILRTDRFTFGMPSMSGYLRKQGGRMKTWKTRWCLVKGGCLYYFREKEDQVWLRNECVYNQD